MTRWIDANGVQLRYEHTPGPNALFHPATIVLVHEMGGTLESWDRLVEPLSEMAGVLRYDQRGAGLSEKVPGALSIDDLADDLAALLASLSLHGPVAVVGAAVGAAVAANFAARHKTAIQALVLLAPATVLEPDRRLTAMRRIDAIERLGVRAAFADVELPERSPYDTIRLSSDPQALAATWRMLAGLDMGRILAAISCPTLVAAGRRDGARPPDHVADVARKIPGSSFVELDTGHIMAIETPDLVAQTIVAFLGRNGFGNNSNGYAIP